MPLVFLVKYQDGDTITNFVASFYNNFANNRTREEYP